MPVALIPAIAALAQVGFGIYQSAHGEAKNKKLLAQRKAYTTPNEIADILNATASRASSGYDPGTLDYLTNQVDRGFSSSLNAATSLGADPNQLSNIFDQKIQASMKIGAENQLLNMQNFQRYLQAESVVADNSAAEQKSQQDILKDLLQSASADKAAGFQNIGSGLNAGIAAASAYGTMQLYKDLAAPDTKNLTSTATPAYYVDVYKKLLENQSKSVLQNNSLIRGGG